MSEAKAPEGEGTEKPKGKGKLIIIIVAAVVLLGGGAGAFLFLGKSAPKTEGAEHAEEEKHYATVKLETFIVNLSSSGSFLKTTLMIEYDTALIGAGEKEGEGGGGGHGGGGSGGGEGAKAGGLPGVLGKREPMIRDAIIRVLSSKKGEEVMTLQGKEALKEELVDAINEAIALDEGPVISVYFLEFLVQ